MPAKTAAPGAFVPRSPEEEFGRIGDLAQPLVRHLEDADLVGRPEAVLDGAQDAVVVAALALEIEHAVDHVLDHARAGDLPFLGHMADQHHRGARRLGVADHGLRGGAHLGDRARRGIGRIRPQRLDRIEDDEVGPLAVGDGGENVLDIGLGGKFHGRGGRADALARSLICATASSPET
jgi:hypothetical protein